MRLLEELFRRYQLDENRLIPYGFSYSDRIYSYERSIRDGAFVLKVEIKNQTIRARLIEVDLDEEYPIDQPSIGEFANTLKEEYKEALKDIRDKCFIRQPFLSPQANRITQEIQKRYDVSPEFLWERFPGCGVFRNQKNQKWFGIIMDVEKKKIVGEDDALVEVMNVYLAEDSLKAIDHHTVYPAYHMGKGNWVSILLDDSSNDDRILSLIDRSFDLIQAKHR